MMKPEELVDWFEDVFGVDLEDTVKAEHCFELLKRIIAFQKGSPGWDDYLTYFQDCLYQQCDPLSYSQWQQTRMGTL